MRQFIGSVSLSVVVVAFAAAQPGGFPGGGPGGPMGPPQPGQIVPGFVGEQLKLSAEQKATVEALQKEVDTRLNKLFTRIRRSTWERDQDAPRLRTGGRGPGGPGFPAAVSAAFRVGLAASAGSEQTGSTATSKSRSARHRRGMEGHSPAAPEGCQCTKA